MQLNSCVLILYASYGDGHLQAARSLQESLLAQGVKRVILLDLMAEAHPLINELTRFVYMQSFKTIPHLYGWVYNMTRDMKAGSPFSNWLHSFGIRRLREVLEQEQPQLIVHTFPQLALPHLKTRWGLNIPLINILTDYDLHGRWLHPHIDHYYVPSQHMRSEAIARGIAPTRISVTGIPLHSSFEQIPADPSSRMQRRTQLRRQAGLDVDKQTVLLLAGAYGVLKNVRDIAEVVAHRADAQLVIICGKNETLQRDLDKRYGALPNVHVYGFTRRMSEWMLLSDCAVTKPGGITMSECIRCELPVFLLRPVPGQELANALYLQQQGIAEVCQSPALLATALSEMLDHPQRLTMMQQQMERLQMPDAASRIAEDLMMRYMHTATAGTKVVPMPVWQGNAYR
ncbi:MGDG synthase family glycosyltransferase [Paenibacillus sp. SGZ-1009]|uniref:MGDG synthase family glycosyltransferase n=1 Tax=Paenibacillus campi TaxID=3106031 RepID=UPI002AFEFC08|nr:glycosyltransferase [Paenibacillus sp. SGZ-1009]